MQILFEKNTGIYKLPMMILGGGPHGCGWAGGAGVQGTEGGGGAGVQGGGGGGGG